MFCRGHALDGKRFVRLDEDISLRKAILSRAEDMGRRLEDGGRAGRRGGEGIWHAVGLSGRVTLGFELMTLKAKRR